MGDAFSSSSSSDDKILEQLFVNIWRQRQCVFGSAIVVANSCDMFNVDELKKGANQSMNPKCGNLKCVRYYASNTKVVQNVNQFHIGGVQQVGGVNGADHC
jgi:hypothetical protein